MTPDSPELVGHYNHALVVTSVGIAILAAYAALDLAGRVSSSRKPAVRAFWLAGGAMAMGTGIWCMHYIGMEAFRLPVPVEFDWPLVLLSLLCAMAASGVALFLAARDEMNTVTAVAGSVLMGSGIAAMHYVGMEAMRLPAMCTYSPTWVIASVAAAMSISYVALRVTFQSRSETNHFGWRKVVSALLMGAAIPVMHYMGMSAVSFVPAPLLGSDLTHSITISGIGVATIALVSVLILGVVFVTAFVDRRFAHQELRLEDSEHRYRLIIDTAFDAFIGIKSEGLVTEWNSRAEAIFGWSAQEAIGRPIGDFVSLNEESASREARECLLALGSNEQIQRRFEILAFHRNGTCFPAEMALSAVRWQDRSLLAAFVHDVTGRKLVEQEMAHAKESAEAANLAKGEFLANMSHEIRTPLNGVIGMTELTLETELSREQRDYLLTVKSSADSLLNVINDILDFSKIEAGRIDLEHIPFDLRECIEETLKLMTLRAEEKGLELLCDIPSDVPEYVLGDPTRLRQIVVNLIGNAIKFTPEGEVSLQVRTACVAGAHKTLQFTIVDTGIGIPPDKLETIFDSFTQADTSTTREYGGTGLGLTICRRLVELMNGKIWIQSEVGRGSKFHFTIDMQEAVVPAVVPDETRIVQALVGTRVLVVDDNKTNRRILEGLLLAWGMLPTMAADGESALACLAEAGRTEQLFKLILTDMHMPKMDGFGLVQRIHDGSSLPAGMIMMLSSGGHKGDAVRCQELGIAAYLLKPVRQAELREAIARVLGAKESVEATLITRRSLSEDGNKANGLNILLAEDNLVNQKLAVKILEKRGHTVTVVPTGRQAVSATQHTHYDVVLMDVHMPEMGGIEATLAVRERELTTQMHQAIVAMTAAVMNGDRERCMAAGMDGYLAKPIRTQELDAVLELYGANKEAKQTVEAPRVESPHQALDTQELLDRVDHDIEFIAELAAILEDDFARHLQIARSALATKDFDTSRRSAHALKGALANLAATHAAQIASSLERASIEGDGVLAAQSLESLKAEMPLVFRALEVLCTATTR